MFLIYCLKACRAGYGTDGRRGRGGEGGGGEEGAERSEGRSGKLSIRVAVRGG